MEPLHCLVKIPYRICYKSSILNNNSKVVSWIAFQGRPKGGKESTEKETTEAVYISYHVIGQFLLPLSCHL